MEVKDVYKVKGDMVRFTLVTEGAEVVGIRAPLDFAFLLPPQSINNGKIYSSVKFPLAIQPKILQLAKEAYYADVPKTKCNVCGIALFPVDADAHLIAHLKEPSNATAS